MSWEEAVRWLMEQPDTSELARQAYFGDPLEMAESYYGSLEYQRLRELLPKEKGRALDLGAGNGILSYALAKDGWAVTALEPDPSGLVGANAIRKTASEARLSIEVIEAFGEEIPKGDADYDLVIARQVLHHAADLKKFCSEMARLTRHGGKIVTLRDHVVSNRAQLEAFLATHPLHSLYGGENAFTRQEYVAALEKAGLQITLELGSFDSPINYAPRTRDDLRAALVEMAGPLSIPVALLLKPEIILSATLRIMSYIDRRPGRLISFFCVK